MKVLRRRNISRLPNSARYSCQTASMSAVNAKNSVFHSDLNGMTAEVLSILFGLTLQSPGGAHARIFTMNGIT